MIQKSYLFFLHLHLVPPSISDPVARQIIVLVGEEALLPCEVSGDPFPEVSWSKDMDDIDLYEMDHVYMLQESGSLYIPQAKVPDTAKYLCVAENPAGFVTKELTLIVRGEWFHIYFMLIQLCKIYICLKYV